jgi:hypothetical protein
MIPDATKLNCAGEFVSACDDPYQTSQAVGALMQLLDGGTSVEFLSEFADALNYCVEQAKEEESHSDEFHEVLRSADDIAYEILEFCHSYLAKAYEKRVGRS